MPLELQPSGLLIMCENNFLLFIRFGVEFSVTVSKSFLLINTAAGIALWLLECTTLPPWSFAHAVSLCAMLSSFLISTLLIKCYFSDLERFLHGTYQSFTIMGVFIYLINIWLPHWIGSLCGQRSGLSLLSTVYPPLCSSQC